MTPRYTVEEPGLAQSAAEAQALWQRNLNGYGEASANAKYRLGYVDNPAGQGRLFMLHAAGQAAACGTIALHRRAFYLGPLAVRAAGLADFVVDAGHRSLAPALMLGRRCLQAGLDSCDMVYATPNEKAAPVVRRTGLEFLGDMQRHALPLSSAALMARRLPRAVAVVAVPLADAAIGLLGYWRRWRRGRGWRCTPSTFDDPALDALWAARPADLLLSERSAALLRWRFTGRGMGDAQVCIARDRQGQPWGQVVWRARGGFFEVLDFLTPQPAVDTTPLLLAFTAMARRLGGRSISVEFFGSPGVSRALAQAGLALRPETLPVLALAKQRPELVDKSRWYFTRLDDDTD